MSLQTTYTVLIDSRERIPLKFPDWVIVQDPRKMGEARPLAVRLFTQRVTMATGDYGLLGHNVVVERKAGYREGYANTQTPDWNRFVNCLDRLASLQYAALLWESDPSTAAKQAPESRSGCAQAWDSDMPHQGSTQAALVWACLSRRIPLMMVSTKSVTQRLAVGELVARLLIMGSYSCLQNATTSPALSTPSSSPSLREPSAV